MTRIHVRHSTIYRYSEAVVLGAHRLLVRPREDQVRQLEHFHLEVSPAHRIRWANDVAANTVAWVDFNEPTDTLQIVVDFVLHHFEANPFQFLLRPDAVDYPFAFDSEEAPELVPFLAPLFPEDRDRVSEWIAQKLPAQLSSKKPIPTLTLLTSLNEAIPRCFSYLRREEPGVQSPTQTLQLGQGSCRDFAVFFIEVCRHLDLPARFVSGYLDNGSAQHGSTHAWAEVYLPGAGWKGFDPTLGILACDLHVPVAVARIPRAATPIQGTFSLPGRCIGFEVDVEVQSVTSLPEPASAATLSPAVFSQTQSF